MCGILGSYVLNPIHDNHKRMQAGLRLLHHRGPDDQGLEIEEVSGGTLSLGHTRLSIIDLSTGGHQPMHTLDGRYTIVFNGEIYNYRELRKELREHGHTFRTETDTEVLLAAWVQWGLDCLAKLIGMFVFVVFDRQSRTIRCVRDAFGIKPFFYYLDEKGFWSASELPALLTILPVIPAINLQRAYDYLVWGSYDNHAATFYEGIKHLMPGHWLTLHLDESLITTSARWWWPSIEERDELSFSQAAEKLRAMFLQNIRLHLRSDVPLGAALSGGIDSSAVVCAMRYLEPEMPIHTFTFVAPGAVFDEERWADAINAHVGAVPHKVVVASKEFTDDIDDVIRTQGEPFGSTSIYAQYRVYRLARENGITVTLDGQGADELLAGYNGYPESYLHSLLEKNDYWGMYEFMATWAKWPGRSVTQASRMCIALFLPVVLKRFARTLLSHDTWPTWINADFFHRRNVVMATQDTKNTALAAGRRLVESLRSALTGGGLKSLLRHGDRNSMRWSVESRVPFLTTDLAEFLLSLPESYLLSPQGETKHIFRTAMRDIVPDAVLDRKDKIGFEIPEREWLIGQENRIQSWLDAAEDIPFLHAKKCKAEVAAIIDGHISFNRRAWRLINFCRWMQLQ